MVDQRRQIGKTRGGQQSLFIIGKGDAHGKGFQQIGIGIKG